MTLPLKKRFFSPRRVTVIVKHRYIGTVKTVPYNSTIQVRAEPARNHSPFTLHHSPIIRYGQDRTLQFFISTLFVVLFRKVIVNLARLWFFAGFGDDKVMRRDDLIALREDLGDQSFHRFGGRFIGVMHTDDIAVG